MENVHKRFLSTQRTEIEKPPKETTTEHVQQSTDAGTDKELSDCYRDRKEHI